MFILNNTHGKGISTCHERVNPQEIYEDRRFDNITQVWLGGDHYKWRQMRSNGIDEKYVPEAVKEIISL